MAGNVPAVASPLDGDHDAEGLGSLAVDHVDTVARRDFHTRELFEELAVDGIGEHHERIVIPGLRQELVGTQVMQPDVLGTHLCEDAMLDLLVPELLVPGGSIRLDALEAHPLWRNLPL